MQKPSHHDSDGRFRSPWPEAAGDAALRRRIHEVAREWFTRSLPPDPAPGELPIVQSDVAHPVVGPGACRITWVGHATFLIQLPDLNLLTDPVWSPRVSPISFVGSKRFVPPALTLTALPPIHAVLLSHDHYDHLDRPTVQALRDRFGDETAWYTPLGYRDWFRRLGIERVVEHDWWEETDAPRGEYRLVAAPARHWTRRTPWGTNARLWCSWAVLPRQATSHDHAPRVYFGGDSGYGSLFEEIGERLGPFDAALLPIGAYDPRWFMSAAHMNPEEAVRVYREIGGRGAFIPTHWGTFRLTFEPPLEPPKRLRTAWAEAHLAESDLHIPRHGETIRLG